MKNKIILLTAVMTMFGFTVVSQTETESDKMTFGIRAGVNLQNFNGKDFNGDALDFSMVPRFHAGALIGIPVAPDFYLQTGLLFSTKGAKYEEQILGVDYTSEYNLSYLELPINFLYRPQLGSGHLLLGFGPYLAYGIAGKVKYSGGGSSLEKDIEYTKEYESPGQGQDNQFKPLDFGGNLLFGYELAMGLSFQLNTQLGMAQINADNKTYPSQKTSYKNTGFGISLGYTF